jgi:16S rRNA (uracil1498-N3)-methyltransferase
MRIPRIYHPTPLVDQVELTLTEAAANHLTRVLRLGPGATITLFDGHGGEYTAELLEAGKRHAVVKLGAHSPFEVESPLHITLAQGISKGDRMDYTIQKAVELGVSRIVPLNTERSVVNLRGDRLEKKLRHWQGIIIGACEQCGRNRLPELVAPRSLAQWLSEPGDALSLTLDHRAETTIPALASSHSPHRVTLLVGPEGGLSESERTLASHSGYQGIRLGARVMRTETAALVAVSVLQAFWGDLR